MTTVTNANRDFDLTPHPRILPMLGEIVLSQWRCLAELADNSVDSFLEARRAGIQIASPQVAISVPTGNSADSRITVRDNGPGMDRDTLERAARAGWTSHDPINNLGLFGMGFNIATARLGLRTTIWTTRTGDAEWVGLQIDFEQLTRQQAFITPALTRPKQNTDLSGTEIVIERLKPEQRDWFARAYNRSNVSKQLGRIYSSMIGPAGSPVSFRLELNGNQVRPKLHCIWGGPGNPERTVETARHGTVNAFQSFDVRLDPRPFCLQCWNWLGAGQTACPSCANTGTIVTRNRQVHGWIGIQRYLDRSEYGIDILRNGRKIEIANKDLFKWYDEAGDSEEVEYPIDDPRSRGRIVGEIHLDHSRVPYTKDRFVREDAAWREMVEIVRGNSPLRPDIADRMGAGENNSPLFRLFQAFRRSSPHNKRAGGWSKILVVPDNERAQAMARNFDAGETDYVTDQKWWELVEEADAEVLQPAPQPSPTPETLGGEPQPSDTLGGDAPESQDQPGTPTQVVAPPRTRVARLSQHYSDDLSGQRFEVEAFAVSSEDPVLEGRSYPWAMRRTTSGPWEFYVDTGADAFRSMTFTPLDALLCQLAWLVTDFERGQGSRWTFGAVLVSLRGKYAGSLALDPQELIAAAAAQLTDIARSVVGSVTAADFRSFFDGLAPSRQEAIRVAMASRSVAAPQGAIDDGRFLQYAPASVINEFVLSHPELFFDGNYWDDPYTSVDYGSPTATDEARSRLTRHYAGLLADAVWLAQQSPDDLAEMSRERLMRASLATTLLAPTASLGEAE